MIRKIAKDKIIGTISLADMESALLAAEQAERERTLKEVGEILEELYHKGVSSFKYKNGSYSEGSYYLTFPYDDFIAVKNKFKSGQGLEG
jgi:hypothetical protein